MSRSLIHSFKIKCLQHVGFENTTQSKTQSLPFKWKMAGTKGLNKEIKNVQRNKAEEGR